MAMDENYLAGYFATRSNEARRSSIASNRPIHTGSSKIDWKATKLNK